MNQPTPTELELKLRNYGFIGAAILFIPIVIQVVTKSPIVHFIYWPIVGAFALAGGVLYFKKLSKQIPPNKQPPPPKPSTKL